MLFGPVRLLLFSGTVKKIYGKGGSAPPPGIICPFAYLVFIVVGSTLFEEAKGSSLSNQTSYIEIRLLQNTH